MDYFRLYFHVQSILSILAESVVFYIILTKTPSRMSRIKPLLLKMIVVETLAMFIFDFAVGIDDIFPLRGFKFTGFFRLIGQEYGGLFSIITLVITIIQVSVTIFEICLYRVLSFYKINFKIRYLFLILYTICNQLIVEFVCYFVTRLYLSPDPAVGKIYAADHGLIEFYNKLDYSSEVYLFFECKYLLSISIILLLTILQCLYMLIFLLSYLAYRKIKQDITNASQKAQDQQRRITLMLASQGAIPWVYMSVVYAFCIPLMPLFASCETSSSSSWKIAVAISIMYPWISITVTISLIKPYSEYFKYLVKRLLCRSNIKQPSPERSLVVKKSQIVNKS